ncbi:hypothetical protein ABT247_14460 [Kitasatospora sp. NPDC001539]|uniref:hypothetical protein n=1 Tax=unclassified Kitasatospora TaxID=2633591 RepID=UPI00331F9B18
MTVRTRALEGLAAGAAGTTALNAVTYLDMAVRGRPSSDTPQEAVEALADRTGLPVPGADEERSNRVAGLGPLLGLAAGLGVGLGVGVLTGAVAGPASRAGTYVVAVVAGAAALAAADAPLAALGISDPRKWTPADWAADIVPHLAYGAATAAVLHRLRRPRS